MTTPNQTQKSITVMGVFFFLLITIQYLRIQKPESHLLVKDYVIELCTGVLNADGSIVSPQQRNDSLAFTKQISVSLPDFGITGAINNRQFDQAKITNGVIRTSLVWLIFFILSVFGWLSYCSSCICPNKCPCCTACRRDVTERPYTKGELLVPSIFAIFFSVVIIAVGITGLTYAGQVAQGIIAMRCSFMASFSDILSPANQTVFPGIDGLVYRLQLLKTNLAAFQNATSNTFQNKSQALKTQSDKVLSNLENYNTDNPNIVYSSGQSFYADNQNLFAYIVKAASDKVQPGQVAANNFQDTIKPEQQALNIYYNLIYQLMTNIEQATAPFISNSNFGTFLDTGISTGQNMSMSIQNQSVSLYNFTQPMQQYSKGITQGLQIIYALSITFGTFIILGILILQICKKIQARILVQLGWCFYCIFMIVGFLLGAVLNPVSVVSYEFCDYLDGFLHNQQFFLASSLIGPGQAKDILNECFFLQGDILKLLQMTAAVQSLQNLVNGIQYFETQLYLLNLSSYQKTEAILLANNTLIVSQMMDGTYTDEDPSNSNTNNQITTFNSFKSQSGCKEIGQILCADGATVPDRSNFAAACWHPSLLIQPNAANNYCSNQQATGSFLIGWFNTQQQYWSPLSGNQASTVSDHLNVNVKYQAYIASINAYIVNTNAFIAINKDPNTGLLSGINCKPLLGIFTRIYDALCILFVPAAYRSTILILLLSLSMFFGSLSSFCVGLRFYKMSLLDNGVAKPTSVQQDEENAKLNVNGYQGEKRPLQ